MTIISKVIWAILAVAGFLLAAAFVMPLLTNNRHEPLPDALLADLTHATNFEALALNHAPAVELRSEGVNVSTNQLMGYVILGDVQITNNSLRLKLVEALSKDISYPAHAATCFEPRHGIRCIDGTNIIMMAICYHCGDVYVEWNRTNMDCFVKTARQTPASRQIFEQIFRDAGVKEDEN